MVQQFHFWIATQEKTIKLSIKMSKVTKRVNHIQTPHMHRQMHAHKPHADTCHAIKQKSWNEHLAHAVSYMNFLSLPTEGSQAQRVGVGGRETKTRPGKGHSDSVQMGKFSLVFYLVKSPANQSPFFPFFLWDLGFLGEIGVLADKRWNMNSVETKSQLWKLFI